MNCSEDFQPPLKHTVALKGVQDDAISFGQTVPEIVMSLVEEYGYPVCFDFPAGHIDNNYALKLGSKIKLSKRHNLIELVHS